MADTRTAPSPVRGRRLDQPGPSAGSGSDPRRHGLLHDVRSSMPGLAWWVICLCLAALFLYPVYVMASMALKGPIEGSQIPPTAFPHAPTFGNFTHLASVQGSTSSATC